ncbi:hypothetical protein PGT21_035286 [Puccinia graminis f. sp. tritici]|uniref:Uncharacterized protein n=1 Tax=Puccinia graminis f. sp. tritici TaxID=56615 RepID=A0A5B0MZQ5_PUCGR|nr:hypothetical protein PGT21_035286 [Puccinia graminis f. sp. tritici]
MAFCLAESFKACSDSLLYAHWSSQLEYTLPPDQPKKDHTKTVFLSLSILQPPPPVTLQQNIIDRFQLQPIRSAQHPSTLLAHQLHH